MRRTFIALGVVTALALSVPAATAGSKGTNRPIKGSTSGSTTAACDLSGTCTSDSAGTHNTSHLGKGAYAIDSVQTWTDPNPETNGRDCAETVDGTVTLWAANGDKLVGNIDDTGNPMAVCEVTFGTEYASAFTVVIDGSASTGKFAGASGSYWLTGTSKDADFPTTPGEYTDSGTLSGKVSY